MKSNLQMGEGSGDQGEEADAGPKGTKQSMLAPNPKNAMMKPKKKKGVTSIAELKAIAAKMPKKAY